MANFNKIILIGNLTRDPQLRYLPSQMAICDFGLAVNHKFRTKDGQEREEVLFIDCSCFGRPGEIINQYCQKGKQLMVEGRLKYDTWDDKQGGGKRSKHSVVVDNFQFIGGPGGPGERGDGGAGYDETSQAPRSGGRPAPQRGPARGAPAPKDEPFGDEQQFKEDDIPF